MNTELARRAVACERWRGMPGMQARRSGRERRLIAVEGSEWFVVEDTWHALHGEGMNHWLPDLDDPATLGCLLALVREAWGDETVHVIPVAPAQGVCHWRVVNADDSLPVRAYGFTEAEALVAALEAAP